MKHPSLFRFSPALSLLVLLVLSSVPEAQTVTETTRTETTYASTEAKTETTFEPARAQSATPYGTLGMSNVISAEPIGGGRLNVNFRANFYRQENAITGAPQPDAQVTTASGAVALGLNEYLDAFGVLNIYNLRSSGSDGSGFGTSVIGAQASLPFSRSVPIRFGAQLAALFGTAKSQINTNGLDGYNYLETRTGNDFMVRLTQSLLLTRDGTGFNMHFNEGVISSLESGKDVSLVTGVGVEFIPIISLVLGLEANSRTFLSEVSSTDPLWITPSVTWRTPAFVNINLGTDIAVSKERNTTPTGPTNALEPWRIFGGLTYSIDTKAGEKREAAYKARQDSLQRAELARKAQLAEKNAVITQSRMDSLNAAKNLSDARQKAIRDSLNAKAKQDSLALLQSNKLLSEERSKRSEMEKQLLSTGLLVMDAVYFETGKTAISINSEPYLTLIAKMLTKYPKLQIEIGGHTDNVGGMSYNMTLSQGRSDAVVAYMTRVAPELQGRLSGKGYGYTQPKADNKTAEGRQLNRRTELKVMNRDALREYNQ